MTPTAIDTPEDAAQHNARVKNSEYVVIVEDVCDVTWVKI